MIILSDLFDDVGTLLSGLKHFRHRRHDVSVMQVIDPAEQDFPFEDPTRFRGLEGLPEQTVEPRALRRAYQTEFESFLRQVRGICSELQMDYVLLRTDRPLDVALRVPHTADAAGGENVTVTARSTQRERNVGQAASLPPFSWGTLPACPSFGFSVRFPVPAPAAGPSLGLFGIQISSDGHASSVPHEKMTQGLTA